MFLLVYPNKELRRISNRRPVYGNRVNLLKGSADEAGGEEGCYFSNTLLKGINLLNDTFSTASKIYRKLHVGT